MTDLVRSLRDDEVRQICLIIESLERSTFDFLQLEFGDVKLTIGKGQPPAIGTASPGTAASPAAASPAAAAPMANSQPVAAAAAMPAPRVPTAGVESPDTVAIVAPLLGRFYAQSEPGAAPFVTIGSQVMEDTTVALIEVMKTFNAVTAGVRGVITEICVEDAQLIEYGQVLFKVRPTATS